MGSPGFPDDVFTGPGDPGAIRESARGYARTAETLTHLAAGLSAAKAPSGVGEEAELYRSQLARLRAVEGRLQRQLFQNGSSISATLTLAGATTLVLTSASDRSFPVDPESTATTTPSVR